MRPENFTITRTNLLSAAAIVITGTLIGCSEPEPHTASHPATEIDQQIDWSTARLIAVQDGGRYKTLESFARESFDALSGKENLPGLSPLASLMDWLFRPEAYIDTPVIKVSSAGVRAEMARTLSDEKRERIMRTKRFTPRELANPALQQALLEMESQPRKMNAVNKVRHAQAIAQRLNDLTAIVPQPVGDDVAPWFPPQALLANLSEDVLAQMGMSRSALPPGARMPVPGVSSDDALAITINWTSLRAAWLSGDAVNVEKYLAQLAGQLPTLAPDGVYPALAQRAAEARYYAAGKFTYGWVLYFLGGLFAVPAMVTRWRTPWVLALLLILGGLGIHTYGLGLRWYILGRIPVANIFEAIMASTAIGIAITLLIEVFQRTRVIPVAAAATGFVALLLGQNVLPGAALATIPAILDDIQLRIHTVTVITSYALIFLAAMIAIVYLIGYYSMSFHRTVAAAPEVLPMTAGPSAVTAINPQRPVLAGALPGDEGRTEKTPTWLNNIDWTHLIILNMVLILLFVGGIILGAWWADYSWGRPWGWDPKEVFALNTWLVYAILLHIRFVVKRRGLWTAWLSLAGCAMMIFNWFVVNFYIVGLHSYA